MSLTDETLEGWSRLATEVAEEAAVVLMAGYRSRPQADEKGRADLVTEFDRRSEALVVERLRARAPGIPIVGEEGAAGADPSAERPKEGPVWFVDPLDGTTNFVHGHPFFCVSIGIAVDGVARAGAVVAPALSLRYRGFWSPSGARVALRNDAPCAVSPTTALTRSLFATGFPGMRDKAPDNNFDSFMAVKRASQAVRRCGAAAIDLCFVADGTYEGFWERRLQPWDVCAGTALVRAGSGHVTGFDGEERPVAVGPLVASNGLVHDALLREIRAGALAHAR